MGDVRDLLRERVLERREEIVALAATVPEGFVSGGYSSKIPPADRDEIIRRRRAGESCRSIARDYSCSPTTVSRAIRSRLHETGQYSPDEFFAEQRRKRAEGWEWMKAIWEARDAEERELSVAAQEDRAAAAEYQRRMEESDKEQRRLRRQLFHERQKAKRLAEQGF